MTPSSVFLVNTTNGLFVKRLKTNGDKIDLISDNKEYSNLTLCVDEVTILGKVLGILESNEDKKNLVDTGWKFTGKSENIDHSNNRKIGESFDFRKGKYELGLYFSIQDLENYRIDNGKPLKYSITVHPKQ